MLLREAAMVTLRFRYVVEDVDRYGNPRLYFRRKGQRKIRLSGIPGSDEFMAAYRAALAGSAEGRSQLKRALRGSFGYLCLAYYESAAFKSLDTSTKS